MASVTVTRWRRRGAEQMQGDWEGLRGGGGRMRRRAGWLCEGGRECTSESEGVIEKEREMRGK